MNATIYYIIGAVAVAFTCYLVFLNSLMKKQKQLNEFQSRYSGKPLNERQKRALAHGAILAYTRGDDILSIAPRKRLDEYVQGLCHQWEITGKEDAVKVLNDLTDLKKSEELNVTLTGIRNDPEFKGLVSKITGELKISAGEVTRVSDTFAWDTCRAINVAKWCFWAGHLTEEEAWGYIFISSETAMQRCSNWQDYTISFLLGRSLQGFDPDEVLIYCDQLLKGSKEKAKVYVEMFFK